MIYEGSCDTEDWSNNCREFRFAITGININFKKIIFFLIKILNLNLNRNVTILLLIQF